jgi:hypothetical protein
MDNSAHFKSDSGLFVGQCRWLRGWLPLLILVLGVVPLGGQTPKSHLEVTPLPATTGAPITVVPSDRPDIDCSIEEWNATRPQPYLKLLCPPEGVYAPVRVYLKLSWLGPEDIGKDVDKIITRPRQLTRLRSNNNVVMVRMEISQGEGQHPQVKWVAFNGLVDLALITDSRRR